MCISRVPWKPLADWYHRQRHLGTCGIPLSFCNSNCQAHFSGKIGGDMFHAHFMYRVTYSMYNRGNTIAISHPKSEALLHSLSTGPRFISPSPIGCSRSDITICRSDINASLHGKTFQCINTNR